MSSTKRGLKAVAILEASKGLISLIVGLGIHELTGKDIALVMESLLSHLHLNPGSQIPEVILQGASTLSNSNLTLIAIGALAYSVIRFVEAYGLWNEFIWTEWFALVSGGIYLPFEFYEVVMRKDGLSVFVLSINIVVVWYMYTQLWGNRRDI